MLIDKEIQVGEVVTLKLAGGEEIISKLVDDTITHYKISKPLVLSMTQKGIGMMPFLFTVNPDKDIKISKNSVVVIEITDKEFADQYLHSTTGIAMR